MRVPLFTQAAAATGTAAEPGVGTVVIIGMLIVFSALAVIYLVMMIMERIFRPGAKDSTVQCPFDGRLDTIVAAGAVEKGAVAAIATDSEGRRNEILSPISGNAKFQVKEGDAFRRGDTLFTVEKEADKS